MDFFVWPRVEDKVRAHPVAGNLVELRQKIVAAWDDLSEAEIRRAACEGLKHRARDIVAADGGKLPRYRQRH